MLVTAAHADNIARLRAGTERKIGQKEAVSPMHEAEVEIRNPSGLHARPAATFVKAAGGFAADVRVANVSRDPAKEASAKSVIGVMGLAVARGHRIRLTADRRRCGRRRDRPGRARRARALARRSMTHERASCAECRRRPAWQSVRPWIHQPARDRAESTRRPIADAAAEAAD